VLTPVSIRVTKSRTRDESGASNAASREANMRKTGICSAAATLAITLGPIADPEPNGTFMKDALGVDPKTVITRITLVRCGMGSNIELFSYQSPDQKVVQPKNSDIGGYHIAFYVDDIKAAADYLRAKGVKTMMGPIPITEGPAAGQAIVYFNAPWGLQLEAISYPRGMAYEKDASTILWTPKDPAK